MTVELAETITGAFTRTTIGDRLLNVDVIRTWREEERNSKMVQVDVDEGKEGTGERVLWSSHNVTEDTIVDLELGHCDSG